MQTFSYPTIAELTRIEQDYLPRLTQDREIFKHFPLRSEDSPFLMWEQRDNYVGLQQLRGFNGDPRQVKPISVKQYMYTPGVYGEFMEIQELELTVRRTIGTFSGPIAIDDLVREKQEQLLQRELDRIEQICWTLATSGTFSVSLPEGGVAHTDQFPLQSFTAAYSWSNQALSTPLSDFRNMKLRARGHSVSFADDAIAVMNQTTLNYLLINTNPADLYGRRTAGLGTFNNLDNVRDLLIGDNLPRIMVYDQGYYDDSGSFQLYIPDNKVVVFGKRPAGQFIGEYRMVRNANNPELGPGPYTKVIDNVARDVPRKIGVHRGHSGGPIVYYPSSIVIMSV